MLTKQIESQLCNFVKRKIKCGEYISLRELGRIFGISHTTVKRILQRNNIYKDYLTLKNVDNKTKANIKYYDEQVKLWKRKYGLAG